MTSLACASVKGQRSATTFQALRSHGIAEYTIAGLVREGFVSVAPNTDHVRITDEERDTLASS
jgi:hypothetical protein